MISRLEIKSKIDIAREREIIVSFKYLKVCHTEEDQDLLSHILECNMSKNKLEGVIFQINVDLNFLIRTVSR